jgi:hypothetical protein
VNVPTGIWINEQGRIVRPPEVAYVDDRFKMFHNLEATPYLEALRDWAEKGDRSRFVMSESELKSVIAAQDPQHSAAASELFV